jgi:threonine dehydrogenase-like Zn-dependent dehydrogenase
VGALPTDVHRDVCDAAYWRRPGQTRGGGRRRAHCLCFTDLLVRHGAAQVIVADMERYRLDAACKLGASDVIDAARGRARARARKHPRRFCRVHRRGMWTRRDVSPGVRGRTQAGHRRYFVPHLEDAFVFDWGAAYAKLPRIIVNNSSQAGERTGWVAMCADLVSDRPLDLSYLLTHRSGWDDIPEAFDVYSTQKHRALTGVISVN